MLDRLVYFLSSIDEKKNRDEGHSEKAEYQKVENDCLVFFLRSPLQLNEKERRDAVRFSFSSFFFSLSKRTQERKSARARSHFIERESE